MSEGMSRLAVPVPTGRFRRRSLSGDRDFNFSRRHHFDIQGQSGLFYRIAVKLQFRRALLFQLASIVLFAYVLVYVKFVFRQITTKVPSNQDLDVCSLTAKSANIYFDIKQTVTTGGLDKLNSFRSDDPIWQRQLLQSIDVNRKFKMPFVNNSYPTAGDMRLLVQQHKEGKPTDSSIINRYPYNFLIKPLQSCEKSSNLEQGVYLVFIIKSSVTHLSKRNAIRKTWANSAYTYGYNIRRVFLLGRSKDNDMMDSDILSESKIHGDLLQMDFLDNYRNNTWKTRGGLKWISEYCSSSKYVMLVDDDYYIATDFVIQLLELAGKQDNLYMGWVNRRPSPFRSKINKWYISREDYPYPFYPPFVSAGAMLMSIDFVINVNIASLYTKHFVFDDVFLAIIANKLHISPVSNKLFYSGKIPFINNLFETTLACHGYDRPADLYNAWVTHILFRCYDNNIVNHFLMKTGIKRSPQPIQL